jgi:hypothetical protein
MATRVPPVTSPVATGRPASGAAFLQRIGVSAGPELLARFQSCGNSTTVNAVVTIFGDILRPHADSNSAIARFLAELDETRGLLSYMPGAFLAESAHPLCQGFVQHAAFFDVLLTPQYAQQRATLAQVFPELSDETREGTEATAPQTADYPAIWNELQSETRTDLQGFIARLAGAQSRLSHNMDEIVQDPNAHAVMLLDRLGQFTLGIQLLIGGGDLEEDQADFEDSLAIMVDVLNWMASNADAPVSKKFTHNLTQNEAFSGLRGFLPSLLAAQGQLGIQILFQASR